MLSEALPRMLEAVEASLDLILRWVVLRVCDGNTQCLLRVLDLARQLLDLLGDVVRSYGPKSGRLSPHKTWVCMLSSGRYQCCRNSCWVSGMQCHPVTLCAGPLR